MCICINCAFYTKCWIKKGLKKIPKVYTNTYLKIKLQKEKKVFLRILLNTFLKKQNYEFDVMECECFCEKPGQWIN